MSIYYIIHIYIYIKAINKKEAYATNNKTASFHIFKNMINQTAKHEEP